MEKISIRDVAAKAEVSTATVSHVINQTRYVSDETSKRVTRAIEEPNYIPSSSARSLASRKTNIIGVIVPQLVDPFFNSFIQGIVEELFSSGYELTLATTNENVDEQEAAINSLRARHVADVFSDGQQSKWRNNSHEEQPSFKRISGKEIFAYCDWRIQA